MEDLRKQLQQAQSQSRKYHDQMTKAQADARKSIDDLAKSREQTRDLETSLVAEYIVSRYG
jgi:Spy/CpxP family protein refolding chaperone